MPDATHARSAAASEGRATARGDSERVELPKHRVAYARRVAESRATVPGIDLEAAADLSQARARAVELTAVVISVVGRALAGHPRLNASWHDGGIDLHSRRNVAVASRTPGGIAFPTVFDADSLEAGEIDDKLRELRDVAGRGELRAPQTAGGTFTVHPCEGARSVWVPVTPGQAAALAIGEPYPAPLAGPADVSLAEHVNLCLTVDARVVLPAEAGAFLAEVAGGIARLPLS